MQGTLATDKQEYVWGETVHHTYTADIPGRTFLWIRGTLVQDLDGNGTFTDVVRVWNNELVTVGPDVPMALPNVPDAPGDITKPARGSSTLYAIRYKGHSIDSQTDLATVTFDVHG